MSSEDLRTSRAEVTQESVLGNPDVFELVPPCSLGASVEGKAVRSLEAQNAITRMSLLRYAETIKGVASSHIESGAEDILLHCSQGDIEEMVSIGALTFGGHVQEVIIRDKARPQIRIAHVYTTRPVLILDGSIVAS